MSKLTRELAGKRSATCQVSHQRVHLDLTRAKETDGHFPVSTLLQVDLKEDWLALDVQEGKVLAVTVDGAEPKWRQDEHQLWIEDLSSGAHEVQVRAQMTYSHTGQGLHRYQDATGATYLYTQYEPADARAVYPCVDQPDMKPRWTFVIDGPSDWIILTGGAEVSATECEGGTRHEYRETPPLSSYLTAVIAGPYTCVELGTWKGGAQDIEVPLRVFCRGELADALPVQDMAQWTKAGLDFYHDRYQFDYPWGKYDQVFVPEYNLGAMENPGCVTFNEKYLRLGGASATEREKLANTLMHEMAHMWFGDLVTPRWWDGLWLKESFADHEGYCALVGATEFTDAWASFAVARKTWALQADQLPTTHPIQAEIPDVDAAKQNFDGISYAKGAAALAQLVAYVGEEAFVEGARKYFAEHAFSATEMSDLTAALEEASGRKLDHWVGSWLTTTGPTFLEIADGKVTRVSKDDRPQVFDVGFFDTDGTRLAREQVELDGAEVRLKAQAPWTVLNEGDRTYARCGLSPAVREALTDALREIDDMSARAALWASAWQEVRDGQLSPAAFTAAVLSAAPLETGTVRDTLLSQVETAIGEYTAPAQRGQLALKAARNALQIAGVTQVPEARTAWAKCAAELAAIGHVKDIVAEVGTGYGLTEDDQWRLLALAAKVGQADLETAKQRLAAADTGRSRQRFLTVQAVLDPEGAKKRIVEDESAANATIDALMEGIEIAAVPHTDPQQAVADLELAAKLWDSRVIQIATRVAHTLTPHRIDTDGSEEPEVLKAWKQWDRQLPATLARLVAEDLDETTRRVRIQNKWSE
ncbi:MULTISPECIES: aminopeptidase N [Winkia]|uniref:Aminopeptidase N n=1 Tax=Winkia neuii subsp. anitrata TaxID=29318 RepID=A0AB38XLP6_9ACTO|nr:MULTISPECIES: aminopeptidase N [Winkia]MBS5947560.1 aminopeptidase N [Winkia neuii]MDK7162659.1 aminopeptidase N [Winkia sp. UMB3105]MDK7905341.1 aminopeptidase N [Winkia sp. UMB0889B]MDK8594106.1 aminopeptidase N [Winkia sp. UMB1096A]MDU2268767.1 aminopeptidase N [Winkia neuii]